MAFLVSDTRVVCVFWYLAVSCILYTLSVHSLILWLSCSLTAILFGLVLGQRTRGYALGPVLTLLAASASKILGYPASYGLIVLVISVTGALVVAGLMPKVTRAKLVFPWPRAIEMLASLLLLGGLYLQPPSSSRTHLSWVMNGDAMTTVESLRWVRRAIPDVFLGQLSAGGFGTQILAVATQVPFLGRPDLLDDVSSLYGTALVMTLFILLLVASRFSAPIGGVWRTFLVAFVLAWICVSGLVLGLVGENGFLSIPTTICFIVMLFCVVSLPRATRKLQWILAEIVLVIAVAASLFIVWAPLGALAAATVFYFVLWRLADVSPALRKAACFILGSPARTAFVGFLLTLLFFFFVSKMTNVGETRSIGRFYGVPLVALAVVTWLLFANRKSGWRIVRPAAGFIGAAVGSVIGISLLFHMAPVSDLLALPVPEWAYTYYPYKLLWVVITALLLLVYSFTASKVRAGTVGVFRLVLISLVVILSTITVSTLPAPWFSMAAGDRASSAARYLIERGPATGPVMYFDALGWYHDSTLNGWSGVEWDGYYLGATSATFRDRQWWDGDTQTSLCSGLDLLPRGATVVTANPHLKELAKNCVYDTDSVRWIVVPLNLIRGYQVEEKSKVDQLRDKYDRSLASLRVQVPLARMAWETELFIGRQFCRVSVDLSHELRVEPCS